MAILGQKGSATGIPNICFLQTGTWTPDCNFEAYVYCIGGGGSGAVVMRNTDYSATGGSAGGCVVSQLTLVKDVEYSFTVGAGGASRESITSQSAGNAGTASAFSGSGITTMNAGGGAAGAIHSSGGGAGGNGGTASGGNIGNYVGGKGGTTTGTRTCTGGGAVGLFQTGITPTEVSASERGSVMGGSLSGFARSTTAAGGDLNLANNKEPLPIAVSPFPDIFTWKQDDVFANLSSTDKFDAPFVMNSGVQAIGPFSAGILQWGSDNAGNPIASPFVGGNGYASQNANILGSQGCLGSGSGGLLSTFGSSNGTTGTGGDGAILIFATTMG